MDDDVRPRVCMRICAPHMSVRVRVSAYWFLRSWGAGAQVALRALGVDLNKSEALALLREHDRQDIGLINERDFAHVGE